MLMLPLSLSKLFALAVFAIARVIAVDQQPLFATNPFPANPAQDTGNGTQSWTAAVRSLSAVATDSFTTLEHPAFPEHRVRIKRVNDWCDPTVRSYTGYIDFQARHLFFYFFESRASPEKDPLLMWINGGPGGSSTIGLFMELGPCSIDPETANRTIWNPYSWNNNANIFFLDQPAGVGYSYADYGIEISTTEEAAKDFYAFIFLFLEHFDSFKGRELHLTGESYGGRYLPLFASAIVDNNPKAVKAGYEPINLKSVMIGNGWTDIVTQLDSFYEFQCQNTTYPAVQTISACVRMKSILPRTHAMIKADCTDRFDLVGCTTAHQFWMQEIFIPYTLGLGRNPYDISKTCEGGDLCYAVIPKISEYLNRRSVRHQLGVDKSVPEHNSINDNLHRRFVAAGDMQQVSKDYVAGLLERGIKVLIYVGDYDWICNWIGNEKWTRLLEWTGQAAFASQELIPWYIDGTQVGVTRGAKGLTFATVHAAGHMVPYDKPAEALELLSRWLEHYEL